MGSKLAPKFKPITKNIGLSVWGVLTLFTLLLYIFGDMPVYPYRALPLLWCFFSWNFFAYTFNRRMWPWQFIELHGQDKGVPGWRSLWFWFTAAIYAALLATIAFAGQ